MVGPGGERAHQLDGERGLAAGAAARDLGARDGGHGDLVARAGEHGGDRAGDLDQVGGGVVDQQLGRGAGPGRIPAGRGERAEAEVGEALGREGVGEALGDAGRRGRAGVGADDEHHPGGAPEVEAHRALAAVVEAHAQPAEIVALGLEGAQRGGEVLRRGDLDGVEEGGAARGAEVAGEDEPRRRDVGAEGAGAVGRGGPEAARDQRAQRRGERAGEVAGIGGAEDHGQGIALLEQRPGHVREESGGAAGAGALDGEDEIVRVEPGEARGAQALAEVDHGLAPLAPREAGRQGGIGRAERVERVDRIDDRRAEEGGHGVAEIVRIEGAGGPGDVEGDAAAERRAPHRRGDPGAEQRAEAAEQRAAIDPHQRTTQSSSAVATTKGATPAPSGGHTARAWTPAGAGMRSTS